MNTSNNDGNGGTTIIMANNTQPTYGMAQPMQPIGQPMYGMNQPTMMNNYQPGYGMGQPQPYGMGQQQQGAIIIAS